MKILYIGGESSNFIINLCNAFCKKGHEVTCVVQDYDAYENENKGKLHKNLTKISLPIKELFNPTLVKTKLITKIQKNKYDLIFGSHMPMIPTVANLAKMFGIPWGAMILDIPTDRMKTNRNKMLDWLIIFDFLKYANIVIFNTFVARDEYYKYTNQYFNDDYVITYAIEMPEKFEKSGIDTKGDYVISVCRLTPVKDCKQIPNALSFLDTDLEYVAVGRDDGGLKAIKESCEKNNIKFTHYSNISEEKKYELIKKSSMLIYPQKTKYIGGLSPFEAMYCGVPVIVPEYKILKDLYGKNAEYYNGTTFDLSNKISVIHNLKRELMVDFLDKACDYAKKVANVDIMAEKMLTVFGAKK
jgi:glycosyltransferase involved in cell wall biosynthesis